MSLSLILMTKDQIIISGDSRGSILENSKNYATIDDIQKLYRIDNMAIFTGGLDWTTKEALKRYQESSDKSINNLNEIGKQVVKEFEEKYPDAEIKRKYELVIATFEKGNAVLYSLSSYEGYRITKIAGDDQLYVCCIGTGRNNVISLYKELENKLPVKDIYPIIYNTFASEEVGGELSVCIMTDIQRSLFTYPIIDRYPVMRYNERNILTHCSIGPENGFVAEKSDSLVITEMNATNGISIKLRPSTTASYTPVFYVQVDTASGTANLFLAGDAILTGKVAIGSGNNIFKADSNGIYLGNATFASAPFSVTQSGSLTATAADISGNSNFGGTLNIGTTNKVKIYDNANIGTVELLAGAVVKGNLLYDASIGGVVLQASNEQLTLYTDGTKIFLNSENAIECLAGTYYRVDATNDITLDSSSGDIALNGNNLKVNGTNGSTGAISSGATISVKNGIVIGWA